MVSIKDFKTFQKYADIQKSDIETFNYLLSECESLISLIEKRQQLLTDKTLSIKAINKRIKKLHITYKLIQSVVD